MAGIDNLVKGAVGTFAKDKVASYLSPAQMDFITFALNPQGYLLDKGVNAAANALGYGSQYRELKGGAQDDKEWYKEVMRDTIGDALPGSIGDFVRATPRGDDTPAGMYYDPNVGDFVQSSNPVASSDQFAGDRFGGEYDQNSVFNTNSQNYVGPVTPSTQNDVYYGNMSELLGMLSPYRTAEVPEMVTTGTKETAPDGYTFNADTGTAEPIDFGGTMDYSDVFGGGYSDFGGGGGGGGGKYYDDFSSQAYAKGGQACGCKR
jgi:hypothetical protein